ncbi:Imm52 family immunity protein [Xanthomonas oryzae]|uniref:Imm52 family immunity protein n=1 Tax=Xanthomonas oryzae TaxID=347 RepID=UPI003AAAC51C
MKNHLAQVTIDAYLHEESADVKVGYVRLKAIADALANVDPSLSAWYSLPETKNGKAIALSSREEFIADYNHKNKDTANDDTGFFCFITTAEDNKAWNQPGCATINFQPKNGYINCEINKPVEAFGNEFAPDVVIKVISAIARTERVIFSATNVICTKESGKGVETYAGSHQLFPHRRWLGWMGFVPHMVEAKHIPEAAALIPVGTKGTVIVAVDECFDLNNPDHLKRAHRVEARMAHIGLLDVTDTSLLS